MYIDCVFLYNFTIQKGNLKINATHNSIKKNEIFRNKSNQGEENWRL